MILELLAVAAFVLAAVPAALYLWNAFLFRRTPIPAMPVGSMPISVLIPSRNEERSIAACLESVLFSNGLAMEVIVLDDHSEDRTVEIVREIATWDPRVRIEHAPPLPPGWCGKQAACFTLSKLARYDILMFLDADVRLTPFAIARMIAFLEESKAGLVSGFPRQSTGTFLEMLLTPLINWVLLCFLPFWGMRNSRWSAFGAGCGQWFMTHRAAYEAVRGHHAVKASRHDGLTLPRAYRRAGFHTDICDATDVATCRMYRSGLATWNGLAKNAHEGMGSAKQIGIWTPLLLGGQVLPTSLITTIPWMGLEATLFTLTAVAMSLLPRLHSAYRFQQSWLGAFLHPIGVLALVTIQWYALIRRIIGKPISWKGRTTRPALPQSPDPLSP